MLKSLLTSLVLLLVVEAKTHAQNLLVNGNFESPGGGTRSFLSTGDHYITGWTVTGSAVTYYDRHNDATGEGTHTVEIGYFFGPGGIEQSFATSPNQVYNISFYLASDPFNGSLPGRARVTVGSFDQVYTAPAQSGQLTVSWQQFNFHFQALDATSTLRFTPDYQITGSGLPLLDSVAVTQVPEPSCLGFFCTTGIVCWFTFRKLTSLYQPK